MQENEAEGLPQFEATWSTELALVSKKQTNKFLSQRNKSKKQKELIVIREVAE